jgi:hypothetical protein
MVTDENRTAISSHTLRRNQLDIVDPGDPTVSREYILLSLLNVSPVAVTGSCCRQTQLFPGFLFSLHPEAVVLISGTDITFDIRPARVFLGFPPLLKRFPKSSKHAGNRGMLPVGAAHS